MNCETHSGNDSSGVDFRPREQADIVMERAVNETVNTPFLISFVEWEIMQRKSVFQSISARACDFERRTEDGYLKVQRDANANP